MDFLSRITIFIQLSKNFFSLLYTKEERFASAFFETKALFGLVNITRNAIAGLKAQIMRQRAQSALFTKAKKDVYL
jgi:hypothetical protein